MQLVDPNFLSSVTPVRAGATRSFSRSECSNHILSPVAFLLRALFYNNVWGIFTNFCCKPSFVVLYMR